MRHKIRDEGDLRKYFTAIPNIVYKLGLDTYELALYNVLKQSAGDEGVCWKSRPVLAKESGMSVGMVTKARTSLAMPRAELNSLPLITVREEPNTHGGKPFCVVSIVDIWPQNMAYFATSHSDFVNQPTSHSVSTASPHDIATSPHADQRHDTATKKITEEKPNEENLEKNLFTANAEERTDEDKLLDEFAAHLKDPRFDFERVA